MRTARTTLCIETVGKRLGFGDSTGPLHLLFLYPGPFLIGSPAGMKKLSSYLGRWGRELKAQWANTLAWVWQVTV